MNPSKTWCLWVASLLVAIVIAAVLGSSRCSKNEKSNNNYRALLQLNADLRSIQSIVWEGVNVHDGSARDVIESAAFRTTASERMQQWGADALFVCTEQANWMDQDFERAARRIDLFIANPIRVDAPEEEWLGLSGMGENVLVRVKPAGEFVRIDLVTGHEESDRR
jgi:hypothetical protein